MKRFASPLCVVVLCAFVAGVIADDKKPAAAAKPPTQEEMMAAMAKLAALNENHKKLEQFVGEWKCDVKCWMAPGAEPEKTAGSAKNEMIMGGRYLKCEFSGNMMGQPFTGGNLLGYDNAKGKFFSLWIDSMSTGYMASEGTCDASGKVFTYISEFDCPIRKQHIKMRIVNTVIDNDSSKAEMYDTTPDGQETKSMEILYTRVK
jgi:Protein of unknown function (DUF1579)